MERRNTRHTREIVVPGDVIDSSGMRPGDNAYVLNGKVYAGVMGVRNVIENKVGVIPLKGCYMPTAGDTVIGVINDIGPSNWMVDISAPYPAPLHVNEVPWKVEFGDTSKYLSIGNVVILKVLSVDENRKIQVTMKDAGLRKVEGGRLVKISHTKVSRVIGKGGSMISMIKTMTDCRLTVAQNGMVWIDGDDEEAEVAAEAVRMIEERAQSRNLTELVREFIESKIPQAEDSGLDYEGEE
ncbi:MAG: S1 RNA-binding domain-containing protein [Candidatus Methanomethylophilaceae archaeon]|nr:S1 RNA-binding domain-containing protein [Candidatus Methanomethylophilaceae archaeon]